MNVIRLLVLLTLLAVASLSHAQVACPPGWIPYSASDCGPDNRQQGTNGVQPQRQIRWASRWGAVVSSQGAFGIVSDMPDKDSAISAAQRECQARGGVNCSVNNVYANTCVAVMANGQIIWTENAGTSEEAGRMGMKNCASKGSAKCWVYYAGCSLPQRLE
ncbi:DUF4189 domain-containing protein [Burkholderia cenocepacia]|uniref:DUF4189 domain-containing protein n=2 Tax=Burkholderia cenocepacia TaxID=95486 RepID=A0AAD0N726_9BURK|nr:DUF4189 domain-containing protein [Burkholderia cenocepacia]AWG27517.1 hypothetical protein B9Z07_00645 [Burkholderia cenocepacia]ELK7720964.1 DUF4189 domain-containing protein [Burkholderia cenocepacia]MBR8305602.1 DUF4189 domain-containing protein [Burkholderia cenocepacia]MCA7961637.1 DUF4189 domain-containing protein [Burkholderia cenocepacia]MCF1369574.1 DUF4189 domain-containing protein [Burkholderia cenocepacia]